MDCRRIDVTTDHDNGIMIQLHDTSSLITLAGKPFRFGVCCLRTLRLAFGFLVHRNVPPS